MHKPTLALWTSKKTDCTNLHLLCEPMRCRSTYPLSLSVSSKPLSQSLQAVFILSCGKQAACKPALGLALWNKVEVYTHKHTLALWTRETGPVLKQNANTWKVKRNACLTPSLPWCHLKTTNKSAKFQTVSVVFHTLSCERTFIETQSSESRCYRSEKYTVCRHVRASFNPEILQAGAVKGLIIMTQHNLRIFRVSPFVKRQNNT